MVLSARAHFVMSQLIRSVFWLPAYPAESMDRVERMAGEIKKKLVVHAHKVSEQARKKIEAAGGRVEIIAAPAAEPLKKK